MQARLINPALANPAAMKALHALRNAVSNKGVPEATLHMVELRCSQINGGSACVDMHAQDARASGVDDQRLFTVAAWREARWFSAAEQAALALAEAVTRIADQSDPVTDAIWEDARRHHDETALAALLLCIANINVWNRLNVATRQVAGQWQREAV